MNIVHNYEGNEIKKEVKENISFLLTNRSGGFFSLGLDSRYNGLFFRIGGKVIKIVDDIKAEGKIVSITNKFGIVQRKKGAIVEDFFMPLYTNSLVYETDNKDYIGLLLDVRDPYDDREWGRNYDTIVEHNKIIIKFTKTHDERDGEASNEEEFTVYIVLAGDANLDFSEVSEWVRKEYEFDKKRGSSFERYVYDAVRINAKRIVISASPDKEEAIETVDRILQDIDKFKDRQKKYHKKNIKEIKDKEIDMALRCAVNSLSSLLTIEQKSVRIYAGLPWFFQFWTRDEAISLRAMMLKNEFDISKNILMKELSAATIDGRLPNRVPDTETSSADSIGWHFKRWYDFLGILSKRGVLQKYFDKKAIKKIVNRLRVSLVLDIKNHTHDGLALNSDKETWMDSIARSGSNIELQALRLSMLKLLFEITRNKKYKYMEIELRKKVREKFWNGEYLIDSLNDPIVRPNVFIAAYVYPGLLTNKEWEGCFKNVLKKLWLHWGGLATIDKNSSMFHNVYSGESPESYHNGDSWFWINNLAAIVLNKTNKKKFKRYIDKIVSASTKEILWKGMIGHHAELSSAKELRSEGCLSQAWSSAMFIELINELDIS